MSLHAQEFARVIDYTLLHCNAVFIALRLRQVSDPTNALAMIVRPIALVVDYYFITVFLTVFEIMVYIPL